MNTSLIPVSQNKVVVKSNQFINGYFFNKKIKGVSEYVSAAELKLLATVIAKANPMGPLIDELTVTLDEFNQLSKTAFHPARFKEAVELISSLRYNAMLPDTKDRVNLTGSFAVFRYAGLAVENGVLTAVFRVEEAVYPYISELASNYTKLQLKDYFSLPSATYIRLFEILSQHKYRGSVRISYMDLRKMLSIEDTKYTDFNSFRRRVLDAAQKAIAENTGFKFTFEIERSGRGGKVDSILFRFKENNLKQDKEIANPLPFFEETPLETETERENICAGFSDPIFAEFSNEQLEYLRSIAWAKVPEENVELHRRNVGPKVAREWAVSQFIEQKIKYAKTKGAKNLYAYLCAAINPSSCSAKT